MKKIQCVVFCVCALLQMVLCDGEGCVTIDGSLGTCISIYNCQQYLKLVQEAKTQTLIKAHCGFNGKTPKVCCPSSPPSTTTSTISPFVRSKSGAEDYIPALPDPPVCGLSNASFSKIVEGVNAQLDDFPWMALLGFKYDKNTVWGCGGALISAHHVLTAAHCIRNFEDILYVVRLGELDLASEDDGAVPVDVLIKHMIQHEHYAGNRVVNDIGMLILERDVEFTPSIRPICIPKSKELRSNSFENYSPLVAGWGRTKFDGLPATHLQVVQLPVVSNDICANAYVQYKQVKFDERLMCAGFLNGGKDACKGDSGGPLMQPIWSPEDKKAYFYNIGIISFGRGCAQAQMPGVYTRVTQFVPWIEEKVLGQTR